MAVDLKFLQPLDYYRKFLEQDIRPDGRDLNKSRPTSLNIGSISTAAGSSVVKLGNTTVVCGIKAELDIPKINEEKIGYLVPNLELSPMCSPRFRPGPPSEQAQALTQILNNILESSKCVLLSNLDVPNSKFIWVIYCDVLCINYDGNVLDAAVMALISALQNTKLPKIDVNSDTGEIIRSTEIKIPLQLNSQPVSTTFAIFDEEIILTDPTDDEEGVSSSTLSIAITEDDRICNILKSGGSRICHEKLSDCIKIAKTRAKEVRSLIAKAVDTFSTKNL